MVSVKLAFFYWDDLNIAGKKRINSVKQGFNENGLFATCSNVKVVLL